jgi:hypothetical protein
MTSFIVDCFFTDLSTKKRRTFNPNTMSINQGTHTLPLFQPPIPEPNQVPLSDQPYTRDWQRYGKATLRVYVFQGQPRPGSLTPSDLSEAEEDEDTLPEVIKGDNKTLYLR